MTDDPDLIPITHAAGAGKAYYDRGTYFYYYRLVADGEIEAVKVQNKLFLRRTDIPRAAALIRERGWGARRRQSA